MMPCRPYKRRALFCARLGDAFATSAHSNCMLACDAENTNFALSEQVSLSRALAVSRLQNVTSRCALETRPLNRAYAKKRTSET